MKTRAHIQIMGSASYQIIAKFLLPLLLLILYMQKGLAIREQKAFQIHNYYSKIDGISYLDWNCVVINDPKEIFAQFTHQCPRYQQLEIEKLEGKYGLIRANQINFNEDWLGAGKEMIRKVNRYGLIHSEFWHMLFSLWLFIYYFIVCVLSIFYIVYKRKTEESS